MASLIPSGNASGTGSMTIQAPATNSNQTASLPDATGTVMVSGNMPAFSVFNNAGQTITNGAYNKVTYDTEEFDTNNNFASSTFTPTVAGYYQINANVSYANQFASDVNAFAVIYKNGSLYKFSSRSATNGAFPILMVSSLVYCNGSTDYIEIYTYQATGSSQPLNSGSSAYNFFNGCLIRSA